MEYTVQEILQLDRDEAALEAQLAAVRAARDEATSSLVHDFGMTIHDAGSALGVSHQTVRRRDDRHLTLIATGRTPPSWRGGVDPGTKRIRWEAEQKRLAELRAAEEGAPSPEATGTD